MWNGILIPEYKDPRILSHAQSKQQEVLTAKRKILLCLTIFLMILKYLLKSQRIFHRKSAELFVQILLI